MKSTLLQGGLRNTKGLLSDYNYFKTSSKLKELLLSDYFKITSRLLESYLNTTSRLTTGVLKDIIKGT